MNRELHDHKVEGASNELSIVVLDEPGQGGACHEYCICKPHDAFNQELNSTLREYVSFQNGPIKENGINGVTHEALLAILIDRLRFFQAGDFSCEENAIALSKIEEALEILKSRTRARITRGVEGKNIA